ncbi:hypothetical protein F511_33532 [Dorcoceras hygrometricum]|uniref:Uncharacterized protein n=1 Tax=Dorcoceras hygrometricum TaxID=472368 RepID=A0A2Z7AXQ1_9LAMI|nr:hypothetical protein F511_33532 [Dorcoceras hygrometricum]
MAEARGAARNSAPQRRALLDSARPESNDRATSARSSAAHLQQRRPGHRASSGASTSQRCAMSRAPPCEGQRPSSRVKRCFRSHATNAHKRWAAASHKRRQAPQHERREAQHLALASASARDVYSHVIMGSPLDVDLIQLMPPRRRGRVSRKIPSESEGQNEEVQRIIPARRRGRQIDDEMPPRRRGRVSRKIPSESEGQNEEVQRIIPARRRGRQIDDEVDVLAASVDDMELIMTRFQRMNPQKFDGDENVSFYSKKSAMVSGPELFRCQRWLTALCIPMRFDDFRCDQDLRSVSGICCKSGLRCYVVLISKSDVVLVSETRVCLEIRSELALANVIDS